MMRRSGRRALALVLTFGCLPLQAHHSRAGVDETKRVTLTGVVTEFKLTNPHAWIYLTVTDAQGEETLWKLEGGSVGQLTRTGWTYKSLKPGDRVTVTISPRLDGEPAGLFFNVQFADGASLETH